MTTSELYPVYIILFSNDNALSQLIRKATNQQYSHATISTDSTLNNMYSFSAVPLNISAGFVRESLWSPMYRKNRYFSVLVTFTDKDGIIKINDKINKFKNNYNNLKFNELGLIKYYLNFKDTKYHDEKEKQRWFCSEFVTYILKTGNIDAPDDILQSPSDLVDNLPTAINLGDFTIKTFKESDLKKRTEKAKLEFIKNNTMSVRECLSESTVLCEGITNSLQNLVAKLKEDEAKHSHDIAKYTAFLDWKVLYDKFVTLFKHTDPELRFKLIELIIRKYCIPFNISIVDITNKIVNEMETIYSNIKGRVINFIDVRNGRILIYVNNKIIEKIYPNEFHK